MSKWTKRCKRALCEEVEINKYIKQKFNTLNCQGNANQTVWRFCHTPLRVAIKHISTGMEPEDKRTPLHCCSGCKLIVPLWESLLRILRKLKHTYNSAVPLLATYKATIILNNYDVESV